MKKNLLVMAISMMVVTAAWAQSNEKTFTVNGVSFKMIKVEGGTFKMGVPPGQPKYEKGHDGHSVKICYSDDERPAHSVTLSSYYIGQTEVTQRLWQAVMGNNPSYFKGDGRPVEKVSWTDCQEFILKLNNMTGQHFRLPTEAEWEFAARGGTKSRGYKYSGSNTPGTVAWYIGNCKVYGGPGYGYSLFNHVVMMKNANELGLYDMSGNVSEWCQDWYGEYSISPQTNPKGPASGYERVIRGGSYKDGDVDCRVSSRECCQGYRDLRQPTVGLRLALSE
ncbi:MAG: formylglycine-generating enzyme family protein [Bacteroidaceae bacterium]|nr:formylglycine-generating enzyme family protein [Bacteroidaceae bacterium]